MTTTGKDPHPETLPELAAEAIQALNKLPSEIVGSVDALLHRAHIADGPPALEIDDEGWLDGESVHRMNTNRQQSLAPGVEHIEAICWHWTDTRGCGADNLARRLTASSARAASWHAVIDAAGSIVQSVSAKRGSWHVGSDSAALFRRTSTDGTWEALTPAQRGNVRGWSGNSFMFGIELENAGEVRRVDGKWLAWPFAFGTKWGAPTVVPDAEVISMGSVVVAGTSMNRGYHAFTPAQVDAAGRVLGALARRYGLRRAACAFGHCQIDPARRTDPGPLWMGSPEPELHGDPGRAAFRGYLADLLDRVFGAP